MRIHSAFLVLAAALIPAASLATTKAIDPGQPSLELCSLRAKFLGPEASRGQGRGKSVDFVHWQLDVKEISHASICPAVGPLKLRIRGASFRGTTRSPEITYAVDLHEPAKGSSVELKVQFSKGTDTFTGLAFEEWILKEMSDD